MADISVVPTDDPPCAIMSNFRIFLISFSLIFPGSISQRARCGLLCAGSSSWPDAINPCLSEDDSRETLPTRRLDLVYRQRRLDVQPGRGGAPRPPPRERHVMARTPSAGRMGRLAGPLSLQETFYHLSFRRDGGPGDRVIRVVLDGRDTGGPFVPLADDRADHQAEVFLGAGRQFFRRGSASGN